MASSFYVIPLAYLACIRAILNYKEIYGTSRLSDSMALNIYVPVGPCLLDASKSYINTFINCFNFFSLLTSFVNLFLIFITRIFLS